MTLSPSLRADLIGRIRALSAPLEPRPTGVEPTLCRLEGIRAVLFDLYGTLFVSAAGDVGTASPDSSPNLLAEALAASGISAGEDAIADYAAGRLVPAILEAQHARRRAGAASPEIDIVAVWRTLFRELADRRMLQAAVGDEQIQTLAVEYECRRNPVWPMPGLRVVLTELRRRGLVLGIVSNAQFYSALVFEALLDADLASLGFRADLCVWSWEHGVGKPSGFLWGRAVERLAERDGMIPAEILAVGNDVRNDIAPAGRQGCRTALFAGDARSLRWGEEGAAERALAASCVITDLLQLGAVLGWADGDGTGAGRQAGGTRQ